MILLIFGQMKNRNKYIPFATCSFSLSELVKSPGPGQRGRSSLADGSACLLTLACPEGETGQSRGWMLQWSPDVCVTCLCQQAPALGVSHLKGGGGK